MKINENTKCVLIICETLPCGQQANVAAVLSMTLGVRFPEIVGDDVTDADGLKHRGITRLNLPILAASSEKLKAIRESTKEEGDTFVVDFTEVAQMSRHYDEYKERLESLGGQDLSYIGIGLVGDKKRINKLTGNLKLLR